MAWQVGMLLTFAGGLLAYLVVLVSRAVRETFADMEQHRDI